MLYKQHQDTRLINKKFISVESGTQQKRYSW